MGSAEVVSMNKQYFRYEKWNSGVMEGREYLKSWPGIIVHVNKSY